LNGGGFRFSTVFFVSRKDAKEQRRKEEKE